MFRGFFLRDEQFTKVHIYICIQGMQRESAVEFQLSGQKGQFKGSELSNSAVDGIYISTVIPILNVMKVCLMPLVFQPNKVAG